MYYYLVAVEFSVGTPGFNPCCKSLQHDAHQSCLAISLRVGRFYIRLKIDVLNMVHPKLATK